MSLLIEISASDTPPCQLWQPCVSGCSVRRSRNLCFPRHHQHHVTQPLHHHHHGAGPLHKLDTPSASKAIFTRVQLLSPLSSNILHLLLLNNRWLWFVLTWFPQSGGRCRFVDWKPAWTLDVLRLIIWWKQWLYIKRNVWKRCRREGGNPRLNIRIAMQATFVLNDSSRALVSNVVHSDQVEVSEGAGLGRGDA